MVYAKVSHHWDYWGFVFGEDVLESLVDLLVSANEGSFLGAHPQAQLCEPLVKVTVGLNGLLGHDVWCCASSVIADVVYPAG